MTYISAGDFRQVLDISRRVMASLTGELRYAHFGQVLLPAVVSGVTVQSVQIVTVSSSFKINILEGVL
jgi:hypothetical protein